MTILSKACKPENFESHNSLKVSFMNIWGVCLNFVNCESFLELNSPDIVALCVTNLDDPVVSSSFSVRGYLPLIQKDSSIHMKEDSSVYMKEGLSFAWDLSVENFADSYLCFWLDLLLSVSYSYSSISHLCFWARFLILFHLAQMRFSWSTHLLMCLSLETLMSIIRTGFWWNW